MSDKPSIESNNPLPHPTQTPIQNKNYVSPYSMFYSSNINRQSSPDNNQIITHVNTNQPPTGHIIQTHPPVTEQVTYPNLNVPPTSLLPPQQNTNPYVAQGNHYPSPYQQVNPNAAYPAGMIPGQNNFDPNDPIVKAKIERTKLQYKYRKLCFDQPNLMISKERFKLKTLLFLQSLANVSYFIYFIFKFNTVYLQSLSSFQKVKKSLTFVGIFMLINLPFTHYEGQIVTKSFNSKFHNLSNEEISTIIKELDKQNLKIV